MARDRSKKPATKDEGTEKRTRSPNRDYQRAEAPASRCGVCQSTDRAPYREGNRTIVRGEGIDPVQGPFNVVVLRPTMCEKCGQWRHDRTCLLTERPMSDDEIDEIVG